MPCCDGHWFHYVLQFTKTICLHVPKKTTGIISHEVFMCDHSHKEIPANQLRLENWFADCLQGLLYIHLHWWLARFLNHQQYLMFICNFDGKSAVKPAEMIGIYWNCPPPPSNSPHQDYYICVGNPYKTFTCHCY